MPKNRSFSRKELESLRRADLQSLYKIHGLKGANGKTEALVEALVEHFSSPSFIPPSSSTATKTKPYAKNSRTVATKPVPVGELLASSKHVKTQGLVRRVRPKNIDIGVLPPRDLERGIIVDATVEERPISTRTPTSPRRIGLDFGLMVLPSLPRPPAATPAPAPPQAISTPEQIQARSIPNRGQRLNPHPNLATALELDVLRFEVGHLRESVAAAADGISEQRVRTMLTENDRSWEARLRRVEVECLTKVERMEERLWVLERGSRGALLADAPMPSVTSAALHDFSITSKTPPSRHIFLAQQPSTSRPNSPAVQGNTAGAGPSRPFDSPARKKARVASPQLMSASMADVDSLTADDPRTPSPPRASVYASRNPVPPRTPSPSHQGVGPDNSATPRIGSDFFANPPPFPGSGKKRKKSGPIEELPYPIFATTPKPMEPTSPTTGAPPSTGRGKKASSIFTPGRHRAESATRAVSDAHKELSTITEYDELRPERTRVPSDAPTPTFLGPALRESTGSPPRLSPSPSIGDAAASYSPFLSRRSITATPPRRVRDSKSPSRDYMKVALHGLHDLADSPSAQATPGHRTMLGTERYRDTRFGDIPVFQWGTPSVDLGPTTPGQGQRNL